MKRIFYLILLSVFLLSNSCKKITEALGGTDCDKFNAIKIVAGKKNYYVGEDINLTLTNPDLSNVQYEWYVPGEVNAVYNSSGYSVSSCTKTRSGMYYLNCTNSDCGTIHDSVYITVTNKPVITPCTTVNDSITYSAMPSTSYTATKSQNSTWNKLSLEGTSKSGWWYPNFRILFHDYWTGKEPEDGIYVTSAFETLTNDPGNVYQVHISSLYNNIYMSSKDYDSVYVSHINNKLKVSFCKINLSGTDGSNTYKTTAKGNIIEQ